MDKYKIPNVKTFECTKIVGIENIEFGRYVIIDDFTFIYAKNKIKIGNYVHIASFTSISGGGELEMEDFSVISSGCRIVTATDDFTGGGFGNSTVANKYRNLKIEKVTIKKFAIIGGNSVVLPGVTIGEGASVGAGSVISKDLKPWGVYIGNKKVGERDKHSILMNYKKFCNSLERERIGGIFREE